MITSLQQSKARADNDSLRLLIIDVGLLIKYNALKNHVIVIIVSLHIVE